MGKYSVNWFYLIVGYNSKSNFCILGKIDLLILNFRSNNLLRVGVLQKNLHTAYNLVKLEDIFIHINCLWHRWAESNLKTEPYAVKNSQIGVYHGWGRYLLFFRNRQFAACSKRIAKTNSKNRCDTDCKPFK